MFKTIMFVFLAGQLLSGQEMIFRPMNQICFWGHAKAGVVMESGLDYYKLALPVPGQFTVSYKGSAQTVTVEEDKPGEVAFPEAKPGDEVFVSFKGRTSKFVVGCPLTWCYPVQGRRIK